MKNLEELGLSPIEKEQTRTINGGSLLWGPTFGPVIVILVPQILNEIIKE